jgi:hypothetical protein
MNGENAIPYKKNVICDEPLKLPSAATSPVADEFRELAGIAEFGRRRIWAG